MSRVDALRKLLRLGELSLSEILLIMGGDRDEVEDALARLTQSKEVQRVGPYYHGAKFRLVSDACGPLVGVV